MAYVGYDTTDEDAFHALDDHAVTIKVGDHIETAARFRIPDCAAVQHFLEWRNELRDERLHQPAQA